MSRPQKTVSIPFKWVFLAILAIFLVLIGYQTWLYNIWPIPTESQGAFLEDLRQINRDLLVAILSLLTGKSLK